MCNPKMRISYIGDACASAAVILANRNLVDLTSCKSLINLQYWFQHIGN